jgi:chromate transporter
MKETGVQEPGGAVAEIDGAGKVPPGTDVGKVPLGAIARVYLRIGLTGFGGPPALIAMLRRLCVEERGWVSPHEFQDGIAAASLLPGPAAQQLGIYCGWRVRG